MYGLQITLAGLILVLNGDGTLLVPHSPTVADVILQFVGCPAHGIAVIAIVSVWKLQNEKLNSFLVKWPAQSCTAKVY